MSKVIQIMSESLHWFSDAGNVIASKMVTWFGVASIGAGALLGATNDTVAEAACSGAEWGPTDYGAIVAIVGGVTLVIKNVVDVYYRVKSDGKL